MAYRLSFDHHHDYETDADQVVSVPVTLSANGIEVRLTAKLDTGADYCLFDRKWADAIGTQEDLAAIVDDGQPQAIRCGRGDS